MDSVTQLVLGAAVGEASGGKTFGRKASAWGAVMGTLPDLDVFVPLGDAVRDFTYHRSATHSLLLMLLASPFFGWVLSRIHRCDKTDFWRWTRLVFMCFATHALLDSFTVYGTQLFWPISEYPFTFSTIFIIDPLFTLPLLIGVVTVLIQRQWHQAIWFSLATSCLYLAWSVGIKLHVDAITRNSIAEQQIDADAYLTTPSAFNTLLWRIVVINDDHYYEGYYSIFDQQKTFQLTPFARRLELLTPIENNWTVKRLQWFTKGFYKVSELNDGVVITDIRMGFEPQYVFNFKVAETVRSQPQITKPEQIEVDMDYRKADLIWQRMWNESTRITPAVNIDSQ